MRLFREPLFHFFLLGLAIFGWYAWINPTEPSAGDAGTIVLDTSDAERLAAQFRATWQRPPTEAELAGLLQALVREEVLVREARSLGLDRGDGVVRNRLAQKMEFLTSSVASAMQPEDEVLRKHLERYPERFTAPGRLALEQVYLGEAPGPGNMSTALGALRDGADPAEIGMRSLLPATVPLSPAPAVEAIFGGGFAEALDAQPQGEWSGPIGSAYGAHLVRVTNRTAPLLPPFDEIRDRVLLDWRREMTEELARSRYEALVAQYEVILPDLSELPDGTVR
ncbi:peptidyl-prolyl cis-trans isomerase [Tropicimonas sp. IMCC6043]|uniref:peptidylprolyl isomerase n=1 Tax=Tropicimonas sp. IMCC6043 TaxID=2510645 RepID=UPI0013EC13B1|nr:peptidyl-prolyl cis-trans isomerase [Tropicimonas sp. IMCC6043]